MTKTSNYYEEIVKMLNNFKSEVEIFSALGLTNINKHSENFIKRILNLVYNLELENLNESESNFPGLDLGDSGDGIAYQITATKKSEKIDKTLSKCLKYEHFKTFQEINVFILTSKQNSYSIKTVTEPHFTFNPNVHILDFKDLLKKIEFLDLDRMKALYEYIKSELKPVLSSIKNNKKNTNKSLLNIGKALNEVGLDKYSHWSTKIQVLNKSISAPEIFNGLNKFLPEKKRNNYLPIFNNFFRQNSTRKEIIYLEEIRKTHAQNYYYGNGMRIIDSAILVEKANYTDGEILSNLLIEMVMVLTCGLFFKEYGKENFQVEITIRYEANTKVYFFPRDSIVLERMMSSYILDSPFEFTTTISDIETDTLTDLLQNIMHCFVSESHSQISDPFVNIDRENTVFVINNIKRELLD